MENNTRLQEKIESILGKKIETKAMITAILSAVSSNFEILYRSCNSSNIVLSKEVKRTINKSNNELLTVLLSVEI